MHGLFECFLGRGADLRPRTDFNGKDEDDAGEDHGSPRLPGGGHQRVRHLRAFSGIRRGRFFGAAARVWERADERR